MKLKKEKKLPMNMKETTTLGEHKYVAKHTVFRIARIVAKL